VRKLSAVDLFCGGGGLTEGFKQVGFDVRACLDIWSPAVETHRKNHPEVEVFQADILEFEPSELPKCDVLIGSPPCTEFSYANRGGHGDLGQGMRFVLRFLRFVHEMRPKFWIMENVPRLYQTLPTRVPLSRLGVGGGGHLDIPVRRILNSADYGVPQKRLRLISGRFPVPEPTHTWADGLGAFEDLRPWVPVQTVLGLLPNPLDVPRAGRMVHDPCYDIELPETDLTEHFFDTRLSPQEIEINRKSKTDHSWYGRMAFPDPIDRPARTVMATQTGISRETLVLEGKRGDESYFRRPTIRECASFQSFPITYQFWGSTAQTRYKVIGNAVPPLLAAALAKALLKEEGLPVPPAPAVTKSVGEKPPVVTLETSSGKRGVHTYPESRRFRDHIPGSKGQGVRVDFANVVTPSVAEDGTLDIRWEARLVVGSGKTVTVTPFSLIEAVSLLARWPTTVEQRSHVLSFLARLQTETRRGLLDSEGLQALWSHRLESAWPTPPSLLVQIGRIVDALFPDSDYRGILVSLPPSMGTVGKCALPLRTLAQLVSTAFVADGIMRGGKPANLRETLERAETAPGLLKARRRALVA
jgi:DNA (cytosine-5)-methyltransferase 1